MAEEDKKQDSEKVEKSDKKACCVGNHSPLTVFLIVVAIVVVIGAAFAAGRMSSRKTSFNKIGGARNAMMQGHGFGGRAMMGQKGAGEFAGIRASGQVSAISGNNITVKTSDKDVTVVTDDQTSYLKAGDVAKQSDLKVNDTIVATGQSNAAGEIKATSIKIK